MKTMRYFLIVTIVSAMSLTSAVCTASQATAQNLAEQPVIEMHSTSAMPSSGSNLPQAAVSGTSTTEQANSSPKHPGQIHRVTDHPDIPFPDPLGDVMWPLMLLAIAYICVRAFRKYTRERK